MRPLWEQALLLRRAEIRARWMELLVVEPVTSPLANPCSLLFKFEGTLELVFAALRRGESPRPVALPECPCGHNPYLAYFRAGTQALHEALILIQAAETGLDPVERDFAFNELNAIIRGIASREIEAFAAFCQHCSENERSSAGSSRDYNPRKIPQTRAGADDFAVSS